MPVGATPGIRRSKCSVGAFGHYWGIRSCVHGFMASHVQSRRKFDFAGFCPQCPLQAATLAAALAAAATSEMLEAVGFL